MCFIHQNFQCSSGFPLILGSFSPHHFLQLRSDEQISSLNQGPVRSRSLHRMWNRGVFTGGQHEVWGWVELAMGESRLRMTSFPKTFPQPAHKGHQKVKRTRKNRKWTQWVKEEAALCVWGGSSSPSSVTQIVGADRCSAQAKKRSWWQQCLCWVTLSLDLHAPAAPPWFSWAF